MEINKVGYEREGVRKVVMNCDILTEDLKEVRVNVDACFSVSGRRTNNNQKLLERILGRAKMLV